MTTALSQDASVRKPLRLWPGVVLVVLQWLLWLVVPLVAPQAAMFAMFGALACGLIVVIWWLFFSRAPWAERIGAIALMPVAVIVASRIVHQSISNAMMGMMLPIYSIPVLSLALVAALVASRRFSSAMRRATIAVAIALGCASFALLRTGGISGEGDSDLHWRWTMTPEERLLAETRDEPLSGPVAPPPPAAAAPAPSQPAVTTPGQPAAEPKTAEASPTAAPAALKIIGEWSGFRGRARDSIVRGVRVETDWSRRAPSELWRHPIGPAWSSFAVHGDLVYTQEQRGEYELVSCYRLTTGEPVWRHRDSVRFWESNGGAGPRATPTLHNGRVYAMGATGIVNVLDATTGAVVWTRDAAKDTGAAVPEWGFAGSPLVIDDAVIVAASGRLVAYDIATGNPRWTRTTGGGGYSSPHVATFGGVRQIVLQSGGGVTSVAPADGEVLWQHAWGPGVSIVQPALTEGGDVLVSGGDAMGGFGIRRLAVAPAAGGWSVEERWTSRGLKPYFNDFVVHEGHAFGFDGSILSCINLQDGERKWKGGRYGHGQLVVLPDQDLLLVLSEEGELALVSTTPDKYTEVARFKAIEGKTWNHPVIVGDIVLVRNGEEMAAFRLRAGQ